jgi:hypothetical protein
MSAEPIIRTIVKVGERYWSGLVENGAPDLTPCLGFAATFPDASAACDAANRVGILDFTTPTYREYRR